MTNVMFVRTNTGFYAFGIRVGKGSTDFPGFLLFFLRIESLDEAEILLDGNERYRFRALRMRIDLLFPAELDGARLKT
jgi:hypothetical protein